MSDSTEEPHIEPGEQSLPDYVIRRAVKCSSAQAVVGTIYAALTGGMFLLAYALKLGFKNEDIGLLSTIPMYCVLAQLLSSALVERGISRRRLTVLWSILQILAWIPLLMLARVASHISMEGRVWTFIGICTLITLFSHLAANTRSSWVGDLIPERTRGSFFGRMGVYGGIINIIFAAIGATFLDHVKDGGLAGFNVVFLCGLGFGLVNALLFFPQADVPTVKHEEHVNYMALVKQTFANRGLMLFMIYALVISMQVIAGPFVTTYVLRDLKMPYLGFSLLNGTSMLGGMVGLSFWGRIIDKYGCRPIIVAACISMIPVPLVWIWMTTVTRVYAVTGPLNVIYGFISAGLGLAGTTLIYKLTPSAGRSVQLAIYSVVVTLAVAPLPAIGGHIPGWLHALGIHTDVRCIFYLNIPIMAAAVLAARRIKEPDSAHTADMVRDLPASIRRQR